MPTLYRLVVLALLLPLAGCMGAPSPAALSAADGGPEALAAAAQDVPAGYELVVDNDEGDDLLDAFHMAGNPAVADEDRFTSPSGRTPETAWGALYWSIGNESQHVYTFALGFSSQRDAEQWAQSSTACPRGGFVLLSGAAAILVQARELNPPMGGDEWDGMPGMEPHIDMDWEHWDDMDLDIDGPPHMAEHVMPLDHEPILGPAAPDAQASEDVAATAAAIAARTGFEDTCQRPGYGGDGNDRVANATALAWDGNGPFAAAEGDPDWYTFTLDAPASVTLQANATDHHSLDLEFYGEGREYLDFNWGPGPAHDGWSANRTSWLAPGTYYVRATSWERVEAYWLTLSRTAQDDRFTDADNDPGNATALSWGANGPFTLDPEGDQDWFRFEMEEAGEVDIQLAPTAEGGEIPPWQREDWDGDDWESWAEDFSEDGGDDNWDGGSDSEMWLYDGSLALLERNDDRVDLWSGAELHLGPGTHYLRVGELSDGSIPEFWVHLAQE